jgi:hypothetical protein
MNRKIVFSLICFVNLVILTSCGEETKGEETKEESKLKENIETESQKIIRDTPTQKEDEKSNYVVENNVGKWLQVNPKNKIFLNNQYFEYSATFHEEDSVRWKIESQDLISKITVIEERTGKVVIKKSNVKTFNFSCKVNNTDVFTLVVTDKAPKYLNLYVARMPQTILSAQQSTEFNFVTLNSKKGVKNAIAIDEVNLVKAVNEPRKIVLSSNVSWSGESKIIVPLELPKGTKQLLYEVRISGENKEIKNTKNLFSKVSTSVNKYKILGKTIFETNSTESSITRDLLNSISMPKREKISANIFFFPDDKNGRAFQDKNPKFDYDIKNSLKNTQSMNGIIKPQNNGFVYLGFEATSTWNETFIWIDAVAIQIQKKYVIIKKIPKESTSY